MPEFTDVDEYMAKTRFYKISIELDEKEYACMYCATEEVVFDEFGMADIGIFRSVNWLGPFGLCHICYQHYTCKRPDSMIY